MQIDDTNENQNNDQTSHDQSGRETKMQGEKNQQQVNSDQKTMASKKGRRKTKSTEDLPPNNDMSSNIEDTDQQSLANETIMPSTMLKQSAQEIARESQNRVKSFFERNRNLSNRERLISTALGGVFVTYGASQFFNVSGWAANTAGLAFLVRGATGYCPVYQALDINTTPQGRAQQKGLLDPHPFHIKKSMTIWRPLDDVYQTAHDLSNMRHIIPFLNRVQKKNENDYSFEFVRSENLSLSVDVHVNDDAEQRKLTWTAKPTTNISLKGNLIFKSSPKDGATEIVSDLEITPPAGAIGAVAFRTLSPINAQLLSYTLGRFKQFAETGEVATTKGQPSGRKMYALREFPKRMTELAGRVKERTLHLVGERRIAS